MVSHEQVLLWGDGGERQDNSACRSIEVYIDCQGDGILAWMWGIA